MKKNAGKLMLVAFMGVFLSLVVEKKSYAEEPTDTDLVWHGFISQGFIKTSANNFLAISQEGSFDFTEVGLNVTKSIDSNFDLGAQLFSRKFGPTENFNVKFDWFYANYSVNNWFKFKVGRIKIPFGLYNELSDIDSARVPILLPQSVYPSQSRNYLLAQNGVQVYGYGDLGKGGSLDYHLYAGSINLDLPPVTSTTTIISQIDVPHLLGGRLLWETPVEGLKAAISLQKLSLDLNFTQAATPASTPIASKAHLPATLSLVSFEYTLHRLLLATEFGRQYVETYTNPAVVPYSNVISERYFLMANYQLTDSFAPGAYYSMLTPNIYKRGTGPQSGQGDLALYVRYDFSPNWLMKLEGHLMSGTAGLNSALNDGTPISGLANSWQAIILKTTASF